MTRRLLATTAVVFVMVAIVIPTSASAGGFCADPAAFSSAATTEIEIEDYCFSPTVAYVEVGDTVTFTNQDAEAHFLGGVNNVFGNLHDKVGPGADVSYAFVEEGTFPYLCIIHPGMGGAVVVGDGLAEADFDGALGAVGAAEPPADASEGAVDDSTTAAAPGTGTPAWIVVAGIALGLGVLGVAAIPRRREPSIG